MNTPQPSGNKSTVTREQIREGLRQAGLKKGDLVVAHSSLKSFGHVVGGADAVIDALLDVLGLEGTLIMPSHTNIGDKELAAYDALSTPVRKNIGKIPDTFWRRRDVLRGRHPPRHPWAAKGPLAGELIALSESMMISSQHTGGLLNRVADLAGYVLLMGSMHNGNTSVHTGQALAVSAVEGVVKAKADFMTDFDEIDEPLKAAGVMKVVKVGDAELRLMKSRGLFAVIKDIYLRKYRGKPFLLEINHVPDPDFLSCLEYHGSLRAMRVLQDAYERIFAAAQPGTTAGEMDALFAAAFETHGGSFAGEASSFFVNQPPLKKRDTLNLDGAIRLDGYHAALGRCAVLGRITRARGKNYQKMVERQDQVAAAIQPDIPLEELFGPLAGGLPFEVCRVGRRPRMAPLWGLGDCGTRMFEAGQIIAIGLKTETMGMVRDMYRVDKQGATRLSTLSRTIHG